MNSTRAWPSALGRPSESEVRPKDTSFGRGAFGVCEFPGEGCGGEGELTFPGREDDMLGG